MTFTVVAYVQNRKRRINYGNLLKFSLSYTVDVIVLHHNRRD